MQAGRPGTVTIATNMAGRGTDIVLGGNLEAERTKLEAPDDADDRGRSMQDWQERHDKVVEMGGLHIIGTERHESRRIDNQLRGRSGRQGDPGSSRFYLSLEDNLMRIFGDPERIKRLLSRAGMKEGEAIESKLLSRQIEQAQRKVEAHNFDIRKQLLEYDDVANDQRKVMYQQRTELMDAAGHRATRFARFAPRSSTAVDRVRAAAKCRGALGQGGLEQRRSSVSSALHVDVGKLLERDQSVDENGLRSMLVDAVEQDYDAKAAESRPRRDARAREGRDAARSSICIGRSTSPRSTICAKAFTCAAMRSAIRSRSTNAKPSRCSARCLIA